MLRPSTLLRSLKPLHSFAHPLRRTPLPIRTFTSTPHRLIIDPNKIQPPEDELKKERAKLRDEVLTSHPDQVSTTSSIRGIAEMGPAPGSAQGEVDVRKGIQSELNTVKETFALRDVPKEVYWFGLGGLVPYAATSATTLFMAWDVARGDRSWIVTAETAQAVIEALEPIQVGLGAVILSFLGAIHWGLEFASYGGSHYRRYIIGILAPIIAWPTTLLPFEYALLTQFVGFTGMYFVDSKFTTWGWAPKWYATYRFVLTAVVGAGIIGVLVGRGQLGEAGGLEMGEARRGLERLKEEGRRAEKEGVGAAVRREEAEFIKNRQEVDNAKEEEGEEEDEEEGEEEVDDDEGKKGAEKKSNDKKGDDDKNKGKEEKEKDSKEEKSEPKRSGKVKNADPAKNANEGKEGKQGVYGDKNQLKEGGGGKQGPEPSAEKKSNVKGAAHMEGEKEGQDTKGRGKSQ